jgi:hypothetical protein
MDENQQIMWWLAQEQGCSCEICGVGTWIKRAKIDQQLPSYLVLYHRDGQKENKKVHNVALRCLYCSERPNIRRESFEKPRKKINKNHAHYGSQWYNNGLMNKFIKPEEFEIFKRMGWERGKMVPKDKQPPNHKGKIRITNGVINKFWNPADPIPEGWWRGKLNYSKIEKSDYRQGIRDNYHLRRRRSRPR